MERKKAEEEAKRRAEEEARKKKEEELEFYRKKIEEANAKFATAQAQVLRDISDRERERIT
jgi:hypothetical protein